MPVPTITQISPNVGHTGGGELVEITGSGFQLWTIPQVNGPAGDDVWPTVDVRFGGAAARDVLVISPTRLMVRPPISPLPAESKAAGEGTVDVTVRNIDTAGATIDSETTTLANGYRYLRRQMAAESDLQRLVRTLVLEMRRQIIDNVSVTTHSDYDIDTADGLDVVDVATLPAIVVFGPTMQENRSYGYGGPVVEPRSANEFERIVQTTDDLLFSMVCISDSKMESINLQAAVREFFLRNTWIEMARDPRDPSKGTVRYALDLDAGGLAPAPTSDQKSNLRSFSGSFVVRGFSSGNHVIGLTARVTEEPSITSSQKNG